MSDVIDVPADIEPTPTEIETCELCGFAIEDFEELIYLRAADLIAQWELADPRDAWRHIGEERPSDAIRNSEISRDKRPPPYTTPQSVVDAFLYVARNHDAEYLARWLEDHPQD